MTEEIARYLRAVSVREPEVLQKLRAETAPLPKGRMQITPEQGQFMALLVHLMGAERVLEVGVFTGYSSLVVALALPHWGKLIACDISHEWTQIARRYWREAGVEDRIELRLRPALETLEELIENRDVSSFDIMFIDADKENYRNYYERGLQLLRPGGLLLIDNVLWHGRVADPSVDDSETAAIRSFNEAIHQDQRVWLSMLPIGDGLTLAVKRTAR